MKQQQKAKESFEKLFSELEKIVAAFESGNLTLDESMREFERGLTVALACKKRLREVENKIREIKERFKEDTDDARRVDDEAPF